MRYENIETTMRMTNKVNGKNYEVTEVAEDGTFATLTEILTDDQITEGVEADVLEMNMDNAVCFRLDPDSIPVHTPEGYDIVNGILMHGGAPVTKQGELVFGEILGYVPGKVVLTQKIEKESKVLAYDVAKDHFDDLHISGSKFAVVKNDLLKDAIVFTTVTKEEVEAKDEDGDPILDEDENIIKKTVYSNDVAVVYDGSDPIIFGMENRLIANVSVKEINNESAVILESGIELYYDATVSGMVVDEKKDNSNVQILVYTFKSSPDGIFHEDTMTRLLPSSPKFVGKDIDGNWIIKTDSYLYFENRGHRSREVRSDKIAELNGYDHLVNADIRNSKEIYVFANDDLETLSIVKTKTYDRGDIVEIM